MDVTIAPTFALMDSLPDLLDDPARGLTNSDAAVRRLAVSACAKRLGDPAVLDAVRAIAATDLDVRTRAQAVEILSGAGTPETDFLIEQLDGDDLVAEAAATALGEIESPAAVEALMEVAGGDGDKLVREAAVAALGAIGDDRARTLLIELTGDAPPQIRRRAVVALTAFDGAEVEDALRAARNDRNPMVREVAEAIIGPEMPGLGDLTC